MAEEAGAGRGRAHTEADTTVLVHQARYGDEAAFRALYRLLTPQLLSYASVVMGPNADADAVVAQCWLQLARDVLHFDGDGGDFRRLALTVTRAHARRLPRHRRLRRPARRSAPAQRSAPAETEVGHRNQVMSETVALIATLPRIQAEAVLLRTVLAIDPVSTARILRRRPEASETALSRGLHRLARLVDGNTSTGCGGDRP